MILSPSQIHFCFLYAVESFLFTLKDAKHNKIQRSKHFYPPKQFNFPSIRTECQLILCNMKHVSIAYSGKWKGLFLCYQYKCSGHTQICLHFFIKKGYRVFHFHIHKPLNIHSNRSHRLTLQLQRHKTVNFKLLQVAHLSSLKT